MTQAATHPNTAADPLAAYEHLQVWLDGRLVPAREATVSAFDHGVLYGDGVFEGIRIYNGRVLKLETHVKRFFDSARSIRLALPYTPQELFDATKQTCEANGIADGYIRLVATRGAGTLGINPFQCPRASVYCIAATIQLYPKEFYEKGLRIVSSSYIRNHPQALSPRIKSLNYLNNVLAKIEAIDAGVLEAVMYNHEGFVAECTGDNLFIVREQTGYGGQGEIEIATPPLSAGILEGITRNIVVELCGKLGIKLVETNLTRHDLYVCQEMFLTGSAAEVVPVVEMDGRILGDGTPGSCTRKLITAFREYVANAPED